MNPRTSQAYANRPPSPKFYHPDLPSNSHKLFRRSNSDEKTDPGDRAKEAKTVLKSVKELLDVEGMPGVNEEDKQGAVEENFLSAIARDALKNMEKRAKDSKPSLLYLTSPVGYMESTSKQPQKTTARPSTSKVKITTPRPTDIKRTSTSTSRTESPTQKTTSVKPAEGTWTSTPTSTKEEETTKPITTTQRPTTVATNPATSLLLSTSTLSGSMTPSLVLTSTSPGTPQPTSLPMPQGTSQHPVTPTKRKFSSPIISSPKPPAFPSTLTTFPSTAPPLRSTAVQSTSSSLATILTSTRPLSSLHGEIRESSSIQETTRSSTLFAENDSTLSPGTEESTPTPYSTSPSKTTPSIPASIFMDYHNSSSINNLNDTDSSDDIAADVDSGNEQDSSTYHVNASTGALIAAVCFGVIFLLAVMVVLGKHWYEAYQRRHYSKVDYLINGMYN